MDLLNIYYLHCNEVHYGAKVITNKNAALELYESWHEHLTTVKSCQF